MEHIRRANREDVARIAEIEIFNYRLNFYPIFQNDDYYFEELQVPKLAERLTASVDTIWVYDDGVVKGFLQLDGQTVKKLFVEPVLQGQSIGSKLLQYAIQEFQVNGLWALEKNVRAIAFYQLHGFHTTNHKKLEDDTTEFLVWLER